MRFFFIMVGCWVISVMGTSASFTPASLSGQTFVHDPSTILKDGANYFIFGIGPGIRTKVSPDLLH